MSSINQLKVKLLLCSQWVHTLFRYSCTPYLVCTEGVNSSSKLIMKQLIQHTITLPHMAINASAHFLAHTQAVFIGYIVSNVEIRMMTIS